MKCLLESFVLPETEASLLVIAVLAPAQRIYELIIIEKWKKTNKHEIRSSCVLYINLARIIPCNLPSQLNKKRVIVKPEGKNMVDEEQLLLYNTKGKPREWRSSKMWMHKPCERAYWCSDHWYIFRAKMHIVKSHFNQFWFWCFF